MNARIVSLLGMLASSLPLVSACAGDLKSPDRFSKLLGTHDAGLRETRDAAASTTQDAGAEAPPACVLTLFQNTCGLSGCHAKGTTAQVDLASAGVADRLLDQPAENAMCKGRTLVATDGSPSLLVEKLSGKPPCGAAMPLTGQLSAKDKQCVFDWVVSVGGSVPDAGSP
jgi:hypothetical protein